jgi:hypothetical protein
MGGRGGAGGTCVAIEAALNMLWLAAREGRTWGSTPLGAFEWSATEFIGRL